MAVMTSAGFESREDHQLPRIRRFLAGVVEVLDFYRSLESNLHRAVFTGVDGLEGVTMSLWSDEKSMIHSVYGTGRHRELMDQSRDGSLFDRSSFTRALLLAERGTWGGQTVAAGRL